MDDVGVTGHRSDLVRLQAADEVQPRRVRHVAGPVLRLAGPQLGEFGASFLVAALADVKDAETDQDGDVRSREGLGDRNQGHRPGFAARGRGRVAEVSADGGERRNQFGRPVIVDACAHGLTHRSLRRRRRLI